MANSPKIKFIYRILLLSVMFSLCMFVFQVTGFADTITSKKVTMTKTSSKNDFKEKEQYDDGQFEGPIGKSGPVKTIILVPEDRKTISNLSKNSGVNQPASTYNYSQDGYSGTLGLVNTVKEIIQVKVSETVEIKHEPRTFRRSIENIRTQTFDASGNLIKTEFSLGGNLHPTVEINEDGYSGSIPRVPSLDPPPRELGTTFLPDGGKVVRTRFVGVFEGTLTERKVITPVYESRDNYTGYYSGTVVKPPVYGYSQDYTGTVSSKQAKALNLGDRPNADYDTDPVNMVTGNFYSTDIDLFIPDRGLPLEIARYYNSLDNRSSIIGKGWRISCDSTLSIDSSTGEISILYPDGHTTVFTSVDGTNQYKGPETVFDILTKNEDNTYELKLQDKRIYKYGTNKKLMAIVDQNGNTINLNYDGAGNLSTIVSATGKTLILENENGRIKSITDPAGRTIIYNYDGSGNLKQVKGVGGGTTNYEYGVHGLTSINDENNKRYIENEYDEFKRVVRQKLEDKNTVELSYDEENMVNVCTFLSTGTSTSYYYNDKLYVIKRAYDDGTHEEITHDQWGNKNSIRDRNGNITRYTFDERGNLLSSTSPAPYNYTTSFTYENDNLKQLMKADGAVTKYDYDSKGNVTKISKKLDNTTFAEKTFAYDNYGRITSMTDEEKNTTIYEYASEKYSNPTKITVPEGNTTIFDYDELNRNISVKTSHGTTTLVYNNKDKVEKIIDPASNVVRMKYDNRGNLVKLINPEQYNAATDDGPGFIYTYDAMDRLLRTTDPTGAVAALQYDARGNIVKQVNPNYYNASTGTGAGIGYEYDTNDRLIRIVNPSGEKARIKYDGVGNKIKIINANNYNENTDNGPGISYVYDSMDRLLETKDDEGRVIQRFVYDAAGRIIKEIDGKGYLSGSDDESRYGIINKYNLAGWLIEKRRPTKKENGTVYYRVTKYAYDKTGKLLEEKKATGYATSTSEPGKWHTISYAYNKNGKVQTISDSMGAYIEYRYDDLGNIVQEKSKINDEQYKIVGYHYDSAGKVDRQWMEIKGADLENGGSRNVLAETFFERDKNGDIKKIISPEKNITEFEYDYVGRVKSQKEHIQKDEIEMKSTILSVISPRTVVYPGYEYEFSIEINPDNMVTAFDADIYYDARIFEVVSTESDDPNVTISADSTGRMHISGSSTEYVKKSIVATFKMKVAQGISGIGYITIDPSATYENESGSNNKFSQGFGKTTIVQIPDMNNDQKVETDDFTLAAIRKGVDINNSMYEDKFDIDGNTVIDMEDLDYIKGWLIGDQNRLLNKLEVEKFLPKFVNPVYKDRTGDDIRVTTYQYDKAGNLIKETDSNGRSIQYTYDENNRIIAVEDKEGAKARLFYDEAGNRIKEVLPENYNRSNDDGSGIRYVYDSMNRLVQVIDALGTVIQANVYDVDSLLVKTIDAKGYQSAGTDGSRYGIEYTYDMGNRLSTITTPEAKLKGKKSAAYTYDALNNILTYTDGEENTTVFETDTWGKITKVTDVLGIQTTYAYDYAGNLILSKDGNQNVTKYQYNSMNLLKAIIDPTDQTISYKYDKEGKLKEEIDRKGQIIKYSYNSDGNIKSRSIRGQDLIEKYLYNKDGSLLAAINNNGVDMFEYTPGGRLKKKIRNGQTVLTYEYDKNGNVSSITDLMGETTSYSYDTANRLEDVFHEGVRIAAYNYNIDNTISNIQYQNGINAAYAYDRDKNITSLINSGPQGNIGNFAYTYDNNGNQLTKTENGKNTVYTYDKLNRLATVKYPDIGQEVYTYDNAGNRLTKTTGGKRTTYVYDTRNQLIKSNAANATTTYKYDDNGNLIEETLNGSTTTYSYDGFNRLIEVSKANGRWMNNEYDAFGLRVASIEDGSIYEYVFDRANLITETNANTQKTIRNIRGLELIAQKSDTGEFSFYMHNAHGDVVNLVDVNGQILNSYQYDAFGNTTNYAERVVNRFRYAGEQLDSITGQYYLRARYYDPQIGRFTQEDTYRGDGLNLYTYVANNPLKYIDPTGHMKCEANKNDDWKNWESELQKNIEREVNKINPIYKGNQKQDIIEDIVGQEIKKMRDKHRALYNVLGAHRYNLQSNGISTQFDILYPLYEEEEKNKNKLVKSFVSGLIGGFNYGTQVSAASAGVAALKGGGKTNPVKDGSTRAAKYSQNWSNGSLNEAVEKFAPNSKPVMNDKGKMIYKNPETGIQVVYDTKGNYFRIEDTTRPRGRNYLDLNGNDMNNKTVNGKQMGRNKTEYQTVTHFNNIDK